MNANEFKAIFLPMKDRIFHIAFRISGNTDDAEDLVQEIYIRFWNSRRKLAGMDGLESYCMAMARNVCIDFIRTRHVAAESDVTVVGEPMVDTAGQIDDRDCLKAVEAIIDTLPVKQQSVIRMHDLAGFSFKEISDATGEREDNVRKLLSRARQKVRSVFSSIEKRKKHG